MEMYREHYPPLGAHITDGRPLMKGNLAHNFVPYCLLYFSSHLDIIKSLKVRNTENMGLIWSCRGSTMKFENPPQSGFPNESLCDVIKLGIPFERYLEFLWRKLNLSEHKDE